ncbi:mitogen-activated protein kinase kinase [Ranunculus cassubicifolius]
MEVLATVGATAVTNMVTNAATSDGITRIMNFEDNHELLRVKMRELQALKDHVKRRITIAENNGLTRTPVVTEWLDRVEEINQEVILIQEQGSRLIEQRCCLACCYPRNWWRRYILGKRMSMMLTTVVELNGKGSFEIVADSSDPGLVQVLPESETVGLDEVFDKVWKLLGEDEVNIMGIYGMGGVGKTTLLKKLNNAFINEPDKFDVVIWVVVSKEFSIRKVQKDIGRRMGLEWKEEEDQRAKAERIFNMFRKKRFVIMLDDIWEPMDLEVVGIPSPRASHNNSKLIFTTRSEDVCGGMVCDKRVKVHVLEWNQAWILFQKNVGQEALGSHPEIPKLAEEVANECRGLPLALIAIGRAMTSKKTPPEWRNAVKTLRKYASEFSGMEHNVLATLKLSYDNLENNIVKRCFIYISLYPEDNNIVIEETIQHWFGDGFLDDCEDIDDALDKGHDIIGILKAACLLESGDNEELEVRMHDLVRDLALWIGGECGKKKGKYVVQAGVGLTQTPNIESWKEAERISLMDNDIKDLSGAPECPYLLTLMLQWNWVLSSIATDFFQYMPRLTVLNLSQSVITNVPKSIGDLLQLRFLDLSDTAIESLPGELGNLVELRYLNLNFTYYLESIPRGMTSSFSRLQMLDIYYSGTAVEGNLCYPSVKELESLEHLRVLGITVTELPMLSMMLLSQKLSSCLRRLCILRCDGLTQLALSSLILGNLKKLHYLAIEDCLEMEELETNYVTEDNNMRLFASLKALHLSWLPKLKILWTETGTPITFVNLSYVDISSCNLLTDLSWLVLVPSLKYLVVKECAQVEEIILHSEFSRTMVENKTILSRLKKLYLDSMPKLKSISQVALSFPCLEIILVSNCPLLQKLPFAATSTKKPLLQIKGETIWWNALQWEDQNVKSSFQPFFQDFRGI